MTFEVRRPPIGSRPGTLAIPPDSPAPRIHVFDYRGEICREADVDDPEALRRYLDSEETAWVDVQGFGDEDTLWAIADVFGLGPLVMEDATNVPQRAKSELRADHQLIIARAPLPTADGALEVPQVCLIVGRNWLLTLQDRYFGFFDPVRRRIREGLGPIREQGPDYLAYALLDTLVDGYYPIVEKLAADLEDLEERVEGDPASRVLAELHRIRRQLVVIRRIGWPQREALRSLVVEHGPFIGADAKAFLRSTEQHVTQIMEAVDSARDTTSGLVDLYLSNLSQRTNEIMKMLTLMASIFIPLTFLAGIYGMNFELMPELHAAWGYPLVLLTMLGTATGMLLYFRHRGWIGSAGKAADP